MVAAVTIEDGGEVSQSTLHLLASNPRCVRVGATQNPDSRLRDYRGRDKQMFVTAGIVYASMYFAYFRGHAEGYMKRMEQNLLDISKNHHTGRLNAQGRSNYAYKWTAGWLYVILAGRDIEQGYIDLEQGPTYYPPPQPDRPFPTKLVLLVLAFLAVVAAAAVVVFLWIL